MQDITKRSNSHVIRIPESEEWGKYLKKYWPKISCICQKASSDSLKKLSSVHSLSRVWLCEPMDYNTPGLPVHHQLPEFIRTHVHWIGDAIQPSHPLLSPSPPFPSIRVFSSKSVLHIRWPTLNSLAFLNLELLTPALWGLTCHCFKSGIPESNQTTWVWVPAQLLPTVTMRRWTRLSEN